MTMKNVVLLSGGLDSAVALAVSPDAVAALTFDYGQRHHREIASATAIAKYYGVPHTIMSLDPRVFQGSALTDDVDVPIGAANLPDATYVPARNTVFLALGAAYAESIGANKLTIGCNASDANAYPDCRAGYLEQFRDVLVAGTVGHVWISAPLLQCTKSEIVTYGNALGVPVRLTWSCYMGGERPCGVCGACVGRGVA